MSLASKVGQVGVHLSTLVIVYGKIDVVPSHSLQYVQSAV
jgi:hypothetical protein